MRRFVEEADRGQWTLLPEYLDDFIDDSNRRLPARSVPLAACSVLSFKPQMAMTNELRMVAWWKLGRALAQLERK